MLGFVILGCEKESPAPATMAVVEPVSAPATTPTSKPARPPAVITIDQQPLEFPPALLRLRPLEDQLRPILCTDDPKEALSPNYIGNSLYIELPGRFSEAADLTEKPFLFVSESSERNDAPTGIFLQGNRYHLQPREVKIELTGAPPSMEAWISGTFLQFDLRDDSTPGRLVAVAGRVSVEVR